MTPGAVRNHYYATPLVSIMARLSIDWLIKPASWLCLIISNVRISVLSLPYSRLPVQYHVKLLPLLTLFLSNNFITLRVKRGAFFDLPVMERACQQKGFERKVLCVTYCEGSLTVIKCRRQTDSYRLSNVRSCSYDQWYGASYCVAGIDNRMPTTS